MNVVVFQWHWATWPPPAAAFAAKVPEVDDAGLIDVREGPGPVEHDQPGSGMLSRAGCSLHAKWLAPPVTSAGAPARRRGLFFCDSAPRAIEPNLRQRPRIHRRSRALASLTHRTLVNGHARNSPCARSRECDRHGEPVSISNRATGQVGFDRGPALPICWIRLHARADAHTRTCFAAASPTGPPMATARNVAHRDLPNQGVSSGWPPFSS